MKYLKLAARSQANRPSRARFPRASRRGDAIVANSKPLVINIAVALMFTSVFLLVVADAEHAAAGQYEATLTPLGSVVDLDLGQSTTVTLSDGNKATIELVSVAEHRDSFRNAVREAVVTVNVNGAEVKLVSTTYHLPRVVGGVQVDCPVTHGYVDSSSKDNPWGLKKAARLRLWPAGSPWIRPDSFAYPVKQRWFATQTQMANVPCYVDGGDDPSNKRIYYHYGLDFGGAEAMVDVTAATDGLVVSARGETLPGQLDDTPVQPRGDVVYVLDRRGWYYRYSHLNQIDTTIQIGKEIKLGDRIGLLGKEGASGGWSHLHFGIDSRQPSGDWGAVDGYAFIWQAYVRQFHPPVLAVARPHHLVAVGQSVTLDGSKSWAANGKITSYTWLLGSRRVIGSHLKRTYSRPGTFNETLCVRDFAGNMAFDFAEVQVVDPARLDQLPPTIHPTFWPTTGIRPNDRVTFKVRSFRSGSQPTETWDFGDGTPPVDVHSDGNARSLAKDGYAITQHTYSKPGDYIVSVRTTNPYGFTAEGKLHVHVASASEK